MINRRAFIGCCCCLAGLQHSDLARATASTINRLPANARLRHPICFAGLSAQRYTGVGLQVSDKPTPSDLEARWSLVAETTARNPYLALVDDKPDQPVIGTFLFEMDEPVVVLGFEFLAQISDTKGFANEILVGCLAHEFGHVIQYTSKCDINFHPHQRGDDVFKRARCMDNLQLPNHNSPVILELHADFMGGWLLGRKGLLTTTTFQGFSRYLFSLGETFFGTRVHHGTPRQRLNAMAAGWIFGRDGTILNAADVPGLLEQLHVDRHKFQSIEVAFVVGEATIKDFFGDCDSDECHF